MSSRNEAKFEDQTHRSAAHSTASLCPIVQLPLSESPREPLQNSLSRHRGQLIGPPAASAGTSLEHPSKSVAGARYVDLRQSPRSSRSSRIIGRKRRVSLFLRIVLVCPSSSRTPNVYFGETNSWQKQIRIRYHTSRWRFTIGGNFGATIRGGNPSKDRGHDATLIGEGLIRHSATGHWRGLLVL